MSSSNKPAAPFHSTPATVPIPAHSHGSAVPPASTSLHTRLLEWAFLGRQADPARTGDGPRRDSAYIAIASMLSTALALFIAFTFTFMFSPDLTASSARSCVLAIVLFLVALSSAITGGALIFFDTDDARGDPSRHRMRSCTAFTSELLLVCSGVLMFVGLTIILTSVICQQLDVAFTMQGSDSLDDWHARPSCQHTMIAGVVVALGIPIVLWVVTATRVLRRWLAIAREDAASAAAAATAVSAPSPATGIP